MFTLRLSALRVPVLCFALVLPACGTLNTTSPDAVMLLAEPVADLTAEQLSSHLAGDEAFAEIFTPESGLGPVFVATSCQSCHQGDGKGHPLVGITRFGRFVSGTFDPMLAQGGPQLQNRAIMGYAPEVLPKEATGRTLLIAPQVTGLGYLEAIADSSILTRHDPLDDNSDGISGRAHMLEAPDFLIPTESQEAHGGLYIGRFGKKATALNLHQQTVNAYLNDMGITSDALPEDLVNHGVGGFSGDMAADPEVSSQTVASVVFYLRTLKVPPRRDAESSDIRSGEKQFQRIGCAACHVPSFTTAKHSMAALSKKTIHPYTDLLLHDMGPGLDDAYTEGNAASSEWRTAPLWGIGLSAKAQGGEMFLLHDGRAKSVHDAILLHGGEAEQSRAAYKKLPQRSKDLVIAFVMSL